MECMVKIGSDKKAVKQVKKELVALIIATSAGGFGDEGLCAVMKAFTESASVKAEINNSNFENHEAKGASDDGVLE